MRLDTRYLKLCIAFILLSFSCHLWSKDLTVASVFTDNMILQREKPIKVWGTVAPYSHVSVRLGKNAASAVAGSDGRWETYLGPEKADSKPQKLIIRSGNDRISLENILVGDVWLASGQSNMLMRVSSLDVQEKEKVLGWSDPCIRYYQVAHAVGGGKLNTAGDTPWTELSPGISCNWSAIATYFASELHKETGVPVGIICAAQGSSNIEAWIGSNYSGLDRIREYFQKDADQDNISHYYKSAHILYDMMLSKVAGYTIKGVIWYQGEANAKTGIARHYGKLLSGLIDRWRETWNDPELPFGIVQLPNYAYKEAGGSADQSWAILRQQQKNVCDSLERTVLAVTADLGDDNNIHPKKKHEAGKRLCYEILSEVYDRTDIPVSPEWDKATYGNGQIILTFRNPVNIEDMTKTGGFEIMDEFGKWFPANAEVSDGIVQIGTDGRTARAIRYAWKNTSRLYIYSSEKMPASPVMLYIDR